MATNIFLDESGYTGDDLLDVKQPVFTIATHCFSEMQARELKSEFFSRVNAAELKHTSLQRNRIHQGAIVALLGSLAPSSKQVKLGLVHKRYALTLKLVDLGVEPSAYRLGFDIYRSDFFKTFGNLLYFVLQSGGHDSLSRVLSRFQALVRRRTATCLSELRRSVATPSGIAVHDEILARLAGPLAALKLADITTLPKAALDVSLTGALQCMHAWRTDGHIATTIVHDRSSNMSRQRALWDALVGSDAPPAKVGYGTELVEFPIGVRETRFVDSRESAGVQIADVLSGALARWAGWLAKGRPAGDAYAAQMDEVFFELCAEAFVWIIWPVPEFAPETTPNETGNYLDYVTSRAAAACVDYTNSS